MSKFLPVRLFFVWLLFGILLAGCGNSPSADEEPPVYSPARVLTPEASGKKTLGSSPLILDISNQDQGYLTAESDSDDSRMNIQLTAPSGVVYHNPEVQEKLEQFGIPVMVERSSYESHPLGRTEWMKLYAVLLGKEDVAEKVFKEQTDKLDKVLTADKTDKTVAFFYINSVGAVNIRKSGDYVSEMISLAGGNYVPEDTGVNDNALSTMNMQMEEFYAKAKDADYVIYNSTIDGELKTIDELLSKSKLLADFKAVKNGNVWCTGKNLFQETTGLGTMIEDIHTMLTTDDDSLDELTYMHKLK